MDNFTDKDMGWNKFCSAFELSDGDIHALVGITKSAGEYQKGKPITVAQIAAVMCYGSQDGRIPQRDFMSQAINNNKEKIEKLVVKANLKVLDGSMNQEQALGLVCQAVVDMMKNEINSGDFAPNAPETIRRKGSSKPLIDTKQMANSLSFEIKKGKE